MTVELETRQGAKLDPEWVRNVRVGNLGSLEAQRQALQQGAAEHLVKPSRSVDGTATGVVLPLQRDSQQPLPTLAFENFTQWHTAVAHLVPVGSPAVLPRTWLEEKLATRP